MSNTPEPSTTSNSPSGQWILVVDDEPSMRALIEIVLKGAGFNVFTADGADEAMDMIRAASVPPALVICDVLMPRIDGLELTRRMCARVKDLNVIFISGHLTDVSWWPTDLREHRFVPKPFENNQLIATVREVLDGIQDAG